MVAQTEDWLHTHPNQSFYLLQYDCPVALVDGHLSAVPGRIPDLSQKDPLFRNPMNIPLAAVAALSSPRFPHQGGHSKTGP
jgi:hypothetical protein